MAELKIVVGADVKQAEQALKAFGSTLDKTTANVQRFSADINKSFGSLPLHNIDSFRKQFLQFKADLSNVKISPIDVTPAQQAFKDLAKSVQSTAASISGVSPLFQRAGADINKSFGTLPLHSINAFRQAFLEFKADLSSVKISAIPPISVDITPAQQALRILTEEAQRSGTSVSNVSAAYARWSAQVTSSAGTAVNSLKQVNATIANVEATSQRSFGAIGTNANQASGAIQKFSTEINRSIGTTPLHNVNAFRQAFIALKTDLASVKIAAIPPVDLNIEPAKQALQSLTADSKRSGILIAQSFGKIPLDGIVNFQKAFFEFKKDLGNVKIAAIPPITIDTTPAQLALKTLVADAGTTAGSVKGFTAEINRSFGLIKIAAIPPVTVDVEQAQQSLRALSAEAQKTGVSISGISPSVDRFSGSVTRSLSGLKFNIETFHQSFQKLKSDLSSIKISAIPPVTVNTEQAQQSLKTLTDEAQRSGSQIGNVSAAYRSWATQVAGSGAVAAKSLNQVNEGIAQVEGTAKRSFGSIVTSLNQSGVSVQRFGAEVNKSLGTLPLHNITAFRQAFLDFKSDLTNVKFAAIPPITADIRPAQQALKTLTNEVEKSGVAVTKVSGVYSKWAGEVDQSSGTAVSALDRVNDGATKVESTYKKSFTSIGASIGKIPDAAKPALKAVSKLGDTVETLRAKLLARQSFLVTEKDVGRIAILNNEIRELQTEILRVKNIGSAGFDTLGNAVVKTGSSFSALSAGAKKGFSALRTLANIIPGIGIGGLIGVATQAVAGLFSMGKAADETAQKLKELIIPINDIRAEAIGGTQDELAIVGALSSAVLDQTKSYGERNNALLKLKKINESYFGDLTLETAKLGLLKTRVDEYTASIINQAVIKAFADNIGKLAVELSKQEKAFNEAAKDVEKYKNAAEEANKTVSKTKSLRAGALGLDPAEITKANQNLAESTDKFNKQAKSVGSLRDQMFEYRTAIQEAVNTSLDFRPLEIDKVKGTKEAGDDLQKLINRAKQLAAELEKIGFIAPAEFSFFDTFEEQLIKARKVFDDFNKGNLKLQPRIFTFPSFSEPQIKEQIQDAISTVEQGIKDGIIKLPPLELEATISSNFAANAKKIASEDFTKAFQDIGRALPPIDLEAPAGFNFAVTIDSLRKFFKASQDITKDGLEVMAADFRRGVDNINSIIAGIAVEGLATIGEAIGTALAGGDISSAFKAFGSIVADGLSAIGKQMIAMSPVIAAIKAALKSGGLNPAVLLPAGIALVAIAAALKASLNKGVTGFAEGGLVFGPTLGLLGEGRGTSRSNPEAIIPLDRLKGMLSEMWDNNRLQPVVLRTIIRGDNLALIQNRNSRKRGRLG